MRKVNELPSSESLATQCYRPNIYKYIYDIACVLGVYMFIVRGYPFLCSSFFVFGNILMHFYYICSNTNFYCRAEGEIGKHKTKLLTDFIEQEQPSLWRVENVPLEYGYVYSSGMSLKYFPLCLCTNMFLFKYTKYVLLKIDGLKTIFIT